LKIIIVLALLVIVGSLGSALYYLLMDRERSPRTVKALTWRIGLSIGLFLLLLAGFGAGFLKPHGIKPGLRPMPQSSATEAPNSP
jgi:small neutral amino acid transporter SnatA (MarC family)